MSLQTRVNSRTSWLHILPPELRYIVTQLSQHVLEHLEEIRVREDRPLEINTRGEYYFLTATGSLTEHASEAYIPSKVEVHQLLDLMTNHSLYTMEEQLRRGYVTIAGGHRVGLAGRTVLTQGKVSHLREISSFNIRIAREVPGAASGVLPHLLNLKHHRIHHTLLVSPPQHGKTTLLRDLARCIASGHWYHPDARWKALKVGIVDERSEIAGCIKGVPSFDLGYRTDVLDCCPKAEGMMMLIRSMSPDVLIVDELGREDDIVAVRESVHAGVTVIASAHGNDLEEISKRPGLGTLLNEGLFSRVVMLKRTAKEWTRRVYDEKRRVLLTADSPPIQSIPTKGGG